MKTKLKLSIIICIFSGLCTTISAKDLNPAYCNSIPVQVNGWNEKEAKATLTGIPKDCQKLWCAYALDGSFQSWCEVPVTYTPGDITVTTPTIIPGGQYWKAIAPAWPGGAASYKKPGFVAFALWSPTNTDPKNQDCTVGIAPSDYDCDDSICLIKIPCGNWALTEMMTKSNSSKMKTIAYSCSGAVDLNYNKQIGDTIDITLNSPMAGSGYYWWWTKKQYKNVVDSVSFSYVEDYPGMAGTPSKFKSKFNVISNGADTLIFEYKKSLLGTPVKVIAVGIQSYTKNSINETNTDHSIINLFPNPAAPTETITIRGEYAADAKVSILSASGSTVGTVTPTIGADAMSVSLSGLNLQAGIYFVRIDSGEKAYSAKLCVK